MRRGSASSSARTATASYLRQRRTAAAAASSSSIPTGARAMSTAERTAFLDATLPDHIIAERALHEGDLTPRLSTWSHADPVTLFGAGASYRSGWRDVRAVFDWLATTFTSCDHYEFELLAADVSGDLAYTVGTEHYRATTASGDTVH